MKWSLNLFQRAVPEPLGEIANTKFKKRSIKKTLQDVLREANLDHLREGAKVVRSACDDVQKIANDFLGLVDTSALVIDLARADGKPWLLYGAHSIEDGREVRCSGGVSVRFIGGCFRKIVLNGTRSKIGVDQCLVGEVALAGVGNESVASLSVVDTWIGRLVLGAGSSRDFIFIRGGVGAIDCAAPGTENPFCGSVTFSEVYLPRTRRSKLIEGAQSYRNMRYHLAGLQNGPAASLFHSAELAVERDDERGLNWIFNFLYEEFSDYGASPVLPLIWIVLLWVLTTTILFAAGVDVGGDAKNAVGWQSFLYGTDWRSELSRAVILGFQPISWLGALISSGHTVPLVPNNFCAQIWLVIDGILSTVLLALFIFALRRRFRMAS
ncbi:MAG: hypothetical protein KF895_14965 [Parvibaculum sp.]|nr:hypothetical protein [Parvibaculum sp.]